MPKISELKKKIQRTSGERDGFRPDEVFMHSQEAPVAGAGVDAVPLRMPSVLKVSHGDDHFRIWVKERACLDSFEAVRSKVDEVLHYRATVGHATYRYKDGEGDWCILCPATLDDFLATAKQMHGHSLMSLRVDFSAVGAVTVSEASENESLRAESVGTVKSSSGATRVARVVSVKLHPRAKYDLVALSTSQAKLKISADHRIAIPGKDAGESTTRPAANLKVGDHVVVGTKTRQLTLCQPVKESIELFEVSFEP
eukprot:CAMPEP_0115545986 /NCGR_PEP_ID=MMETSP0271-20121206/92888_1 /TAXON_ID=71861 /ORGANISM="Scrippsiella trochoidea, Strain CCMP3099" /LENGTH=254 /DNA_ID=CAMNT_0002979353 /DNA_START=26 /DNA_END=788 /DNA_ORIENTATION=+